MKRLLLSALLLVATSASAQRAADLPRLEGPPVEDLAPEAAVHVGPAEDRPAVPTTDSPLVIGLIIAVFFVSIGIAVNTAAKDLQDDGEPQPEASE